MNFVHFIEFNWQYQRLHSIKRAYIHLIHIINIVCGSAAAFLYLGDTKILVQLACFRFWFAKTFHELLKNLTAFQKVTGGHFCFKKVT